MRCGKLMFIISLRGVIMRNDLCCVLINFSYISYRVLFGIVFSLKRVYVTLMFSTPSYQHYSTTPLFVLCLWKYLLCFYIVMCVLLQGDVMYSHFIRKDKLCSHVYTWR